MAFGMPDCTEKVEVQVDAQGRELPPTGPRTKVKRKVSWAGIGAFMGAAAAMTLVSLLLSDVWRAGTSAIAGRKARKMRKEHAAAVKVVEKALAAWEKRDPEACALARVFHAKKRDPSAREYTETELALIDKVTAKPLRRVNAEKIVLLLEQYERLRITDPVFARQDATLGSSTPQAFEARHALTRLALPEQPFDFQPQQSMFDKLMAQGAADDAAARRMRELQMDMTPFDAPGRAGYEQKLKEAAEAEAAAAAAAAGEDTSKQEGGDDSDTEEASRGEEARAEEATPTAGVPRVDAPAASSPEQNAPTVSSPRQDTATKTTPTQDKKTEAAQKNGIPSENTPKQAATGEAVSENDTATDEPSKADSTN